MAFLKDHLKSFVAVILCFTLIFSSFVLAFADSEEDAATSSEEASSVALPSSALLATVTDEDEIALDNAMRELSVKLAATSSEYTATDIYNLLLSFRIFYNSTAQVKVYNQSVLDEINSMEDWLQSYLLNINGDLHYVSGGVSYSAAELLLMIVRALGTYDSSQPDLLGSIAMISGYLSNIDSDSSQLHTDLTNINQLIGLFRSDFDTYFGNLHTLLNNRFDDVVDSVNVFADNNHSDLTAIDSSVDDFASANHTDLTAIDTSISDFADDMNNINWSLSYNGTQLFNYLGKANSLDNAFNGVYFNQGSYKDVYYVFSPNLNYSNMPRGILRFSSVTAANSGTYTSQYNILNVGIYLGSQKVSPKYISFSNNSMYYPVYFSGVPWFNSSSNRLIIHFSSNQSIYVTGNADLSFLPESSKDYFDVLNYVIQSQNLNIMNKFEYLYASDDLIDAKDAQQAQEDAALEEFTGGGSAAASVNDIGSAKDVSFGLKNGLSSGGSVSAPLGVMDSGSGFWDWFSSETMGNLDNTQSNRSLRSSGGEEYIDFYSRNWEQIQDYLGGNR